MSSMGACKTFCDEIYLCVDLSNEGWFVFFCCHMMMGMLSSVGGMIEGARYQIKYGYCRFGSVACRMVSRATTGPLLRTEG